MILTKEKAKAIVELSGVIDTVIKIVKAASSNQDDQRLLLDSFYMALTIEFEEENKEEAPHVHQNQLS